MIVLRDWLLELNNSDKDWLLWSRDILTNLAALDSALDLVLYYNLSFVLFCE